jgi:hypothetical protein
MKLLSSRWPLAVVAVTLSAGELVARLPLLAARRFDPDELEHMHVAWYISHGQVPFRDFFEVHMPLFHFLLAAFVSAFDPARTPEHAMAALVGARTVTWGLSVLIVVLTFVLAGQLRDATTAWVSLPLISGSIVIALRAIEIRPDGLSTVLWLAALLALHAALSSDGPALARTRRHFEWAGLAIGLATVTSQKLLLAGPSLAILLIWYLASSRFGGTTRERFAAVLWMTLGVLVTWAVVIGYFVFQGAALDFVRRTLLEALEWKAESSAPTVLRFISRYEPWTFALVAGGATVLVRESAQNVRRVSNVLLLVCAAGLFLGLFAIPVPYPQYCLTFVPLFAIIGASFLVEATRSLVADRQVRIAHRPSTTAVGSTVVVVMLAVVGLYVARPVVLGPVTYPLLVGAAGLCAFMLSRSGRSALALSVLLTMLAVFPAQWTRWMLDVGDRGQFAELRYVMEHTPANGVVLDGWTGIGVFRRHANYYWKLHQGVRAMLPPEIAAGLVRELRDRRVVPDAVVLDRDLRELSPDLVRFVKDEYVPAGLGDIHLRK